MKKLNTGFNLQDGDGFYADVLKLHEGKSEAQSAAINAKLILLLANHIGDRAVLAEALEKAAEC